MSVRYTIQSPLGRQVLTCLHSPETLARWRARDFDFYEGRVWRVLVQLDQLHDELCALLRSFQDSRNPAYIALQIKMYVVSWATLTDVVALLISEVFDLGLPPKSIELTQVLANRHVANTQLPGIFAAHRDTLRTQEFLTKRNDIVHRSYLDEPALRAIDWKMTLLVAENTEKQRDINTGADEIDKEIGQFLRDKHHELEKHYTATLSVVDEILLVLARVMKARQTQQAR